jgi:hypothetical protein
MIRTITAFDRSGDAEIFEVSCEEADAEGYPYYCFEIKHPHIKTSKNFLFEVARISVDRVMIMGVNNLGLPEYSGKGIVKAMIRAVSREFNCDVVSSSSNPNSEILVDDGRKPFVSRYWKKWCREMSNVHYLKEEDRFIYKRI